MSKIDFLQFYAGLYEECDSSNRIDWVVEGRYDYDTLAEAWETGTYSISGNRIVSPNTKVYRCRGFPKPFILFLSSNIY